MISLRAYRTACRSRRTRNRSARGLVFPAALLLSVFVFLSHCATVDEKQKPATKQKGQLSLFLNGPERASLDITFHLAGISIISDKGIPVRIEDTLRDIASRSVTGRQVILAETDVPEGNYHTLKLLIPEAAIRTKDTVAHLAVPPGGIEIPVSISIRRKENVSLFLIWDVDGSVTDAYLFSPLFAVKGRTPDVSSLLIYVTNEGSNNVSVINRHSGEVVSHIMVGSRPRGVAASFSRERSKIYVANSGSDSISVIDPGTQKVETEIPVRFGREPEGIAVGKAAADNELIFVTNVMSDSVSVFNATTFQETEKIDVGRGPVAIAADPPLDVLAGTRFLSFAELNTLRSFRERFFNLYVANYHSNSVSVLSMDLLTERIAKVTTLDVDWNPIAVSVDYPRGRVYVANYGSEKLSVIDIVELIKGNEAGAVSVINNVARSITGIIADPALDRLYLLQQSPGRIIMLKLFDKGLSPLQSIVPPTIGIIPVGMSPRSFLLDSEARKVYVANQGSGDISVVDKAAKRLESHIPVGAGPYGMALFRK